MLKLISSQCVCFTATAEVCKRVIGRANDVIVYQRPSDYYPCTVVVPIGHVWLAGDNSQNSTDSRSYGPVPIGLLQGRVMLSINSSLSVRILERKMPGEIAAEADMYRRRLHSQREGFSEATSGSTLVSSADQQRPRVAADSNANDRRDGAVDREEAPRQADSSSEATPSQQDTKQIAPVQRRRSFPPHYAVRERPLLRPAMNISTDAISPYDHAMIRRGISSRTDLNQREKDEMFHLLMELAKQNARDSGPHFDR